MNLYFVSGSFRLCQAILQDKARDSVFAQPFRDVVPFVVDGQEPVPPARSDNDGRTGGFLFRRQERCDRWVMNVGDNGRRAAAGLRPWGHDLFGSVALGTGRAIRPE